MRSVFSGFRPVISSSVPAWNGPTFLGGLIVGLITCILQSSILSFIIAIMGAALIVLSVLKRTVNIPPPKRSPIITPQRPKATWDEKLPDEPADPAPTTRTEPILQPRKYQWLAGLAGVALFGVSVVTAIAALNQNASYAQDWGLLRKSVTETKEIAERTEGKVDDQSVQLDRIEHMLVEKMTPQPAAGESVPALELTAEEKAHLEQLRRLGKPLQRARAAVAQAAASRDPEDWQEAHFQIEQAAMWESRGIEWTSKDEFDLALIRGDRWYWADGPDQAIPHYRGAHQLRPEDVGTRLRLIQSLSDARHGNWLAQKTEAREVAEETLTLPGIAAQDQANVLNSLAVILLDLGDLPGARQHMERAIAIGQKHFDPDHPTLAIRYSNLALILQKLGDLPGARQHIERAIAIGEKHFDPDHPQLAIYYSNLAMILKDLGDLQAARQHMQRAIAIEEKHFNPDHPTLAIYYSNLAMILQDLGDLPGARQHIERAIEIDEKHFDPDHPTLAVRYSNLALILQHLGDLPGARQHMQRAIAIFEKHLHPDHPHLATTYSNLALILKNLGDLPGARQHMERAIAIGQKHFDPDHPHLAIYYSNLALILQNLGDLPGARQHIERAIEIDEKHFDPDHPNVANRYNNLAFIEHAEGNTDRACELWRQALSILLKHFDENHPHVQIVQRALADHCVG